MLCITVHRNAESAAAYYTTGLARADYYTTAPLEGHWYGTGAALLGLPAVVTKADFMALCANTHPVTAQQLTPRTKANRRAGYDCTFNAPKSVTLLFEHTRDERILAAFQDAVRETMGDIEQAMQTRVRTQSNDTDRTTGNLVYALFTDVAARPMANGTCDPHLHAHCFVMNATHDPVEQRWKAGQFADIVRHRPYFEALFHARFAKGVRALGYDTLRVGKFWEVAGVSPALREKFSQRTQVIEATAQALGITDPAVKGRLGVTTRQHKGQHVTLTALRAAWQARLTPEDRQELDQAASTPAGGPVPTPTRVIEHVLAHGLERRSTLTDTACLEQALRFGVGHVTVEDLHHALDTRPDLLRGVWQDQAMLTTRGVIEEEQALIRFVQTTHGTCPPLQDSAAPYAPEPVQIDGHTLTLNDGQAQAVRHVLTSQDRVIAIRGGAGVGKTTLMREAVRAIEAGNQHRVFVCAPNVEGARDVLRKEGFTDAETVQKLLVSPALQARLYRQVLWVDEAGLLSVPDMHALLAVAERQHARIILCGDTRQHHAVQRGDALRLLERQAGLHPADVTGIVRQQGTYRQAVQAFRDGQGAAGWQHLDTMGALVEIPETQARLQRLAADYGRLTAPTTQGQPPTALVIAPTHAEGEQVTVAIREHLRAQGRLDAQEQTVLRLRALHWTRAQRQDALAYAPGMVAQFTQQAPGFARGTRLSVTAVSRDAVQAVDGQGRAVTLPLDQAACFEVYRADRIGLAVCDTIRLTATVTTPVGTTLANGARLTVAGFTPDGDIVLTDGSVLDQACGHLTYGYVLTSHSAQSKTVDHVLIAESALSTPAASQEQWYVSLSRGKTGVTIYTDDIAALQDAVTASGARLSATELLRHDSAPELVLRRDKREIQYQGLASQQGRLRHWLSAHWRRACTAQPSRLALLWQRLVRQLRPALGAISAASDTESYAGPIARSDTLSPARHCS